MSKAKLVKLLLPAAIVGGALFLILHTQQSRLPTAGDSAPDFTLLTLTGEPFQLRDHRRRVVVLNFWATWCPPCVEETPSLRRFAEQMRGLGVTVVGVSVDQDAEALQRFVSQFQLSFPIARDPDRVVASRYGTFKFPESYIIDHNGRIAKKTIGATDWQDPHIISFVQSLARPGGASAP